MAISMVIAMDIWIRGSMSESTPIQIISREVATIERKVFEVADRIKSEGGSVMVERGKGKASQKSEQKVAKGTAESERKNGEGTMREEEKRESREDNRKDEARKSDIVGEEKKDSGGNGGAAKASEMMEKADRAELQIGGVEDSSEEAEAMKKTIKEAGHVHITFASSSMSEFAFNWYERAQLIGLQPVVVGALDDELLASLQQAGIPCIRIGRDEDLEAQKMKYCSTRCPHFRKMGPAKIGFIKWALKLQVQVIVSDADVMWLRDPMEYINSPLLREADFMISNDCIDIPADMVDDGGCSHVNLNTGQMVWRPTENAFKLLEQWVSFMLSSNDTGMRDQPALNLVLRNHTDLWKQWHNEPIRIPSDDEKRKHPDESRRIFWAANRSIKMASLPIWLFTNGHTYFVQQYHTFNGTEPLSVHPTYQYGDSPKYPYGKLQRCRDHQLWLMDDDDYYQEGKFMKIQDAYAVRKSQTVPLGADSRLGIKLHFEEDAFRRPMIRDAMAIAHALDRILILPKAVCYCDFIWNSLIGCRAPGAERSAHLPFMCPYDHIFDTSALLDEERAPVRFREQSFLEHSRVPPELKKSRAVVQVKESAGEESFNNTENGILIDRGQTVSSLTKALAPYKDTAILEFTAVDGVLCSLEDEKSQASFDQFVARSMQFHTFWCSHEQWIEQGRPNLNPWVQDVIIRHCNATLHEMEVKNKIEYGKIMNYTDCACEFGPASVPTFSEAIKSNTYCKSSST